MRTSSVARSSATTATAGKPTSASGQLVRVVAPHFVAGFETDGIVRRAAPILRYLVGKTDDKARAYIKKKGWKASVIPEQLRMEFDDGRRREDHGAEGQVQEATRR